jgi:hypothetical protein
MALEFRIRHRRQRSPMSCWWAVTAMVLEYHGRRYEQPWWVHPAFEPPLGRMPSAYSGRLTYIPDEEAAALDLPPSERFYPPPSDWLATGLPIHPHAMRELCRLTGLSPFDHPAFSSWTLDLLESMLRQRGPLAFFGRWHGAPHAIVVAGTHEAGSTVAIADPAAESIQSRGFEWFHERLAAFEGRGGSRARIEVARLNPLHFPTSNPLRDVLGGR